METAISSGVSAPIRSPTGVYTASIFSLAIPFSTRVSFILATLAWLPIMPMYACGFSMAISKQVWSNRCPLVTITKYVSLSPGICFSPFSKESQMTLDTPMLLAVSANFGLSSSNVTSNSVINASLATAIPTWPPPQITIFLL